MDVLAVSDEGALLLGECKWTEKPAGPDVLARLSAKVGAVQADLERPASRIDFAVFSRSGFTEELAREARSKGVSLYDVGDVLR